MLFLRDVCRIRATPPKMKYYLNVNLILDNYFLIILGLLWG